MTSYAILKIQQVPVVVLSGDLDDLSIKDAQQAILTEMARLRSPALILDISQLVTVDSYTVRVLTDLASMTKLLGSNNIFLVGLRPDIALTMVEMGLNFGGIKVAASVDLALKHLGITSLPSSGSHHAN